MPGLPQVAAARGKTMRLQGFMQTRVSLCPGEALMMSERHGPDINLQNNGLQRSIVLNATSQKLF